MKTMKQQPITVLGTVKKVGDRALDFIVLNNQLEPTRLSDFKEKYIVLNVVPSLDTGVCDLQTRKVNGQLAVIPNLKVLTISNDLPFAQKRWCGAAGLDIVTLSDYLNLDFANKYGVNIKELRLLARSIFVLDADRKIIYLEYLDEMGNHPDYDRLLEFIKNLPKD